MIKKIVVGWILLFGVPAFAGEPAYKAYRAEVDRETAATWQKHKAELDPMETRGRARGIDLDHIKPVKQCWLEGLSPKECAAVGNLRLMSAWLNRREGCRAVCGR